MGKNDRFVRHTCENGGAFGRYEPSACERCQQLVNGSPARVSPRYEAIKRLKRQEVQRIAAIRNHSCEQCNCGVVCTAFEW